METGVPKTMRAAVINKFGEGVDIQEEYRVPEIEPDQVLVKLEVSGVCHTDVHVAHGDWAQKAQTPIITGHEGVGSIVKLGDMVRTFVKFKIGDRVGISWTNGSCGECDICLSGNDNLCPEITPVGFSIDGCHAEYVAIGFKSIVHIPHGLDSLQAAAMLCAGVTSFAGVKKTNVHAGQWLAIFGAAGGLGHLAVQFASHMGIKVCAIDQGRERVMDLKKLGATAVVDSNATKNILVDIREICDRQGPDGILVISPDLGTYKEALLSVRPNGTVVALSLPPGSFDVDVFDLVMHGKTLAGSSFGTRLDLLHTLKLAHEGVVKCKVEETSLDQLAEVFESLESSEVTGRVFIRM